MSELRRPTAVDGVGIDAGVAAHYGNPLAEQRALAAGEAVVDLSHRAVLSISGADRLTWINSLTSQRITGLTPGESTETLLLDATGRLEYAVRLLDDGVELWLLLEREEAPGLLAWLSKMVFMLRVEVRDRTAEFATIGTLGSPGLLESAANAAGTASAAAGAAASTTNNSSLVASPNTVPLVWVDPWSVVSAGGWQYATVEHHPSKEWTYSEVLIARAQLAGLELPLAGLLALEALRIAAWRPRCATEGDEKTLPHELDWLRSAVHLTKGCYRGQETVAKVHNLGHPPRRLVMLHLDGSDSVLPSPGDDVLLGEKTVGQVTSAARHFELGPIALAIVKRTTDPLAELAVRSEGILVPAAQQIVVPVEAGAAANVPRLPRLGAVPR